MEEPAPRERPFQPRGSSRLWLAALPAFLITTAMTAWSLLRFAGVLPAMGVPTTARPAAHACAAVYGVDSYNSEFYTRESVPSSGFASPRAPREVSTVVSGMVENRCGEPLKSVRISLKVRAATGARGSGDAVVRDIAPGQAKRFERAWVGQLDSYEIVSIR